VDTYNRVKAIVTKNLNLFIHRVRLFVFILWVRKDILRLFHVSFAYQ